VSYRLARLERYFLTGRRFIVGDWPLATKANLVGGHEGAGVAVAVGAAVQDVKPGDHVGIKVVLTKIILIVVAERKLWSL